MEKIDLQNDIYTSCPIRMILARICEKWPVLILFTLSQQPVMRFRDLHKSIPDISQKMLTSTLRALEEDGLVNRKVYAEVPPRVEYSLTGRATTLLPHVMALIEWAKTNMGDILYDRNMKNQK